MRRYVSFRGDRVKRGDESAVNQAEWDRVKTRLKQEFGESAFKSWVTPITATAVRDGEVELSVPTRFMRDWISTHYAERIRALWSGENPSVRKVTLKVDAARPAPAASESRPADARPIDQARVTQSPLARAAAGRPAAFTPSAGQTQPSLGSDLS